MASWAGRGAETQWGEGERPVEKEQVGRGWAGWPLEKKRKRKTIKIKLISIFRKMNKEIRVIEIIGEIPKIPRKLF
jgi:hypothetical protein